MSDLPLFDGRSERDLALARLEEHRPDWLAVARAAARAMWLEFRVPITVNDVREICPPPEDIDPRVMGAVFNKSEWEPVGFVLSNRRTCHARPIRTFRMK